MSNADGTASVEADLRDAAAEYFSSIWWVTLVRGVLLALLGCYALVATLSDFVALFQVIAVFQIVDGVLAVVAGIVGLTQSRAWTITRGFLGIVAGIVVLSAPLLFVELTAIVLVFVIAFQCVGGGILEIIAAIQERRTIQGPGWLLFSGVLSILLGIVIMGQPILTAVVLAKVFGIVAIGFGVAVVVMAMRIRRIAGQFSDAR